MELLKRRKQMKKAMRMIAAGILIGLGSVMLPGCGSSNGTKSTAK